MVGTFTINVAAPIQTVEIYDNESALQSAGELPHKHESEKVSQICLMLKGLAEKLNQSCDKLFTEHKDEIAKLSLEIARKILIQKVSQGDYEIESIIKEAIKIAPTQQNIAVHLNPEDFVKCQKLQQEDLGGVLASIKFICDPDVGRAECVLDTPKGIVKSLMNEHLDRIGKALNAAE
jgi:flagellar biosynthesis/type III secretory pathway protein FliH